MTSFRLLNDSQGIWQITGSNWRRIIFCSISIFNVMSKRSFWFSCRLIIWCLSQDRECGWPILHRNKIRFYLDEWILYIHQLELWPTRFLRRLCSHEKNNKSLFILCEMGRWTLLGQPQIYLPETISYVIFFLSTASFSGLHTLVALTKENSTNIWYSSCLSPWNTGTFVLIRFSVVLYYFVIYCGDVNLWTCAQTHIFLAWTFHLSFRVSWTVDCAAGWLSEGSHSNYCFYVSSSSVSWDDAVTACEALAASLATISNSSEEYSIMSSL